MPHVIVEYSKNLEETIDIPVLLEEMHEALSAQGVDKTRIKTRAIALSHSVIGDANSNEGQMAHITLLLLEGRDVETKKGCAIPIHEIAKKTIQEKFPDCAVTLEVRDMVKETYIL